MTTIIGIDPHKASHTATAINPDLTDVASIRVRSSQHMTSDLLIWAEAWPDRQWAVEGAGGLGHLLAQQLVAAGQDVVDVPATLVARVRLLDSGHGRKTDRIDAKAVAVVAAQRQGLRVVEAEQHDVVLRMLADRRRELTAQRRQVVNRLHRHLRDLVPGGATIHLSAKQASSLLNTVRSVNAVDRERKSIARDLVTDLRRLDKAMVANRDRSREAVASSGTTLTELAGISDVLAAKIIGHVGRVERFKTSAHLASYAGIAPIEVSSGDRVRHRLSRQGNRQLNSAVHLAAHAQAIHPGPGRDYLLRRLAMGDSRPEAMRVLKRQIIKSVYRVMTRDAQRAAFGAVN